MKDRNFGIDLLRILSMFMICILHILWFGVRLDSLKPNTLNNCFAWLLEILNYCAVDCFAMISGYVMLNNAIIADFHFSKIFRLWFQVFFILSVITILFLTVDELNPFLPEELNNFTLKSKHSFGGLLKNILPLYGERYWYFSAYFGLYFISPFINKICCSLNYKEYKLLLLVFLHQIHCL